MIEIRVSNEVDFWLKLGEALQLKSGNNNGIESRGFSLSKECEKLC